MISAVAVHHEALTGHARLFIASAALVFIIFILELVRRHRLHERYSILWLLTGLIMLFVAAFPSLLSVPGSVLGIQTPALSVFAVAFLAVLLLLLHLTATVSEQGEHITRLAQELAIERAARQSSELEDAWVPTDADDAF